jgi:hypothetical protein
VLRLADLQGRVRQAVVRGDASAIAPLLIGGRDPRRRLAVHSRHYHASLATALLDRFPAASWLAGSALVTAAARAFVAAHPPSRPCLAEYGEAFPAFLAAQPGASGLPYLRVFAELEWHLARLSLTVTRRPLTWAAVQSIGPERIAHHRLTLQPDVRYLHAPWAIDDLMRVYLADRGPERFVLRDEDVWLELRGARGALQLTRLDRAVFVFRDGLRNGRTLADAALAALEIDPAFDAGAALAAAMVEGLVVGAHAADEEER